MIWKDLIPYHEVRDQEKFEEIVESIRVNGWKGVPLVVHNGHLLTGSHRFAAACEIAKDDYEFELPTVELTLEFELDENDLGLVCEGYGWQLTATEMARDADKNLAAYYGMDIN
jgi:ParB-like chromosome segregation protein Spo0J